jgi:hypothetical protein
VIAVFTKYDQFKIDIEMKLEDEKSKNPYNVQRTLEEEMKGVFQYDYLGRLGETPPHRYTRLESEGFGNQLTCTILISVL